MGNTDFTIFSTYACHLNAEVLHGASNAARYLYEDAAAPTLNSRGRRRRCCGESVPALDCHEDATGCVAALVGRPVGCRHRRRRRVRGSRRYRCSGWWRDDRRGGARCVARFAVRPGAAALCRATAGSGGERARGYGVAQRLGSRHAAADAQRPLQGASTGRCGAGQGFS